MFFRFKFTFTLVSLRRKKIENYSVRGVFHFFTPVVRITEVKIHSESAFDFLHNRKYFIFKPYANG